MAAPTLYAVVCRQRGCSIDPMEVAPQSCPVCNNPIHPDDVLPFDGDADDDTGDADDDTGEPEDPVGGDPVIGR